MDFFKMVNHFFNRERGVIQNPLAPERGAAPEVLAPTEVAHPAPDQKERAGLRRGILTSIGKVEQIPLPHILSATENFDEKNFIARGGFGKVYKGHSEEYGTIAVKRLDHGIRGQGQHEFMMEIELLSAYKHENLASLVGFCDQDGEKILVYKHESNGSLDKLLRSEDLNWIQRLQICLDAAKGLKYLHHDVGPLRRVVHRDVKSSNILLDENLKAKISDFGLSKVSHTNESCSFLISNACGTIGYVDPEYATYGMLTEKSDVFSFGVVLFEVLCGRLALVVKYADRRRFLRTLAPHHFDKNTLHKIIYPILLDQMDPDSLKTFSTIAYNCLTKSRQDRPSMTEIVEQLQKALDEQLAALSGSGPGAALQQGLSTSMDYMTQSGLMPSSPSSSRYTPASSSQSWKHDVFLSFRGTGTCNTFVDRLYSVLVQKGIYTYKDDQTLPRGETIGPSLFKAIEESHIAVIVFSENYADSSWCLQELAHIMKCKDERGLIVMPIFYHIDPSELGKQEGKYGAALAEHELEGKNVESWRKALVDAGNLSGDVANGPETIFIKGIVDTISERLCVAISSDDEDLIDMEARLQDLKSMLAIDSHDVLMVGIWGLGGGGKTTLASALYDEISTNFDGSCFVKDIREESSKHGLEELQGKILSIVLKQKREEVVGDVERLIRSRLRRKKVLIVLDDVDHLDQLKALAGSHYWFGKGSRIIITTRDKYLLMAHKVNVIYNISLLNDNESMKLFCKHAPRDHRPIEDYEMLSKNVVAYANGVPLALKVQGSVLCDKDMSEWMSALARLKDIPDYDIVERLKISYDGLKPMEKELFLDIACFFRGRFKDSAMEILDACGFHPIIGVKVLIQKALITVSEEGRFDMDDQIQEMGHYIVRGENPKNPELHSRIWQEEDVVKICAIDATAENNKIEALQVKLQWDELPQHRLPEVVANMKKLRWISWEGYAATSLPREFQPMKLCYLQLEGSLLEQLWEGYKHLPNLKVIDLRKSLKLVRTPDFSGLPSLERMILDCCVNLREIHPSIGYHERLLFLNMNHCKRLAMFPPIIGMKKLETLILSNCYQLRKFPEIQTNLDNFVKLHLKGSGIKIIPPSVGKYCTNLLLVNIIVLVVTGWEVFQFKRCCSFTLSPFLCGTCSLFN